MKTTKFIISTIGGLLILGASVQSQATIVNFDEVALPSITLLDGTSHYDAFGISFADETFSAIDSRFAQADNAGITSTSGSNNLVTVNFTASIVSLEFGWLTISSNDLFATAYDAAGGIVDTFSVTGLSGTSTGVGTLSGAGIASVTWNDGTGQIGIDYLDFSVPEPSLLALLSIGLLGMGVLRRKKV